MNVNQSTIIQSNQSSVESLKREFEIEWHRGSGPSLESFLVRAGDSKATALVELLKVDLEYRWQSAKKSLTGGIGGGTQRVSVGGVPAAGGTNPMPVKSSDELATLDLTPAADINATTDFNASSFEGMKLEEYAQRIPELNPIESISIDLICAEYLSRCRAGVPPQHEEYRKRFPGRAAVIEAALQEIDVELTKTGESKQKSSNPQLREGQPQGSSVSISQASRATSATTTSSRFVRMKFVAKGGLGQVSLAKDSELNRSVALKEILPKYADSQSARVRFLREAEITGRLEHPGIVPVYSLGADSQGRPYYAMRFIRGQAFSDLLDAFHKRRMELGGSLSSVLPDLRRHVQRLIEVCYAVDYAHNNGVLHRDIKPSNVMIGEYGETLVIDWGLAKLISQEQASSETQPETKLTSLSKNSNSETAMGSIVGTPAFMSPEQARGIYSEVGPPSDVYSLGASLYCILTGKAAFSSGASLIKQVLESDFRPPMELLGSIPRPLNAICLRAMSNSPALRYASARELAIDLECWLNDEPVVAYKETKLERWQRWKRRNQAWVRAGQAVVLVGILFLTGATILVSASNRREKLAKERESVAKDEAIKHKRNAIERLEHARRAIDTWLTDGATALQYTDADPHVRLALLERAASDYQSLMDDASTDVALELERGKTALRLGNLYLQLARLDDAERVYTDASQLFRQYAQQKEAPDDIAAIELANAIHGLGLVAVKRQRFDESLSLFAESAQSLSALLLRNPDSDYLKLCATTVLASRMEGLLQLRRLEECNKLATELKKIEPSIVRTGWTEELAQARGTVLRLLSAVKLEQGDYAPAIAHLEQLVDQLMGLPDSTSRNVALADSWAYLAIAQRRSGNRDDALATFEKAANAYGELESTFRSNLLFSQKRAVNQFNLGLEWQRKGNITAAKEAFDGAAATFEEFYAMDPTHKTVADECATVWAAQGHLHLLRAEYISAKQKLTDAVDIWAALKAAEDANARLPHDTLLSRGVAYSHLAMVAHELDDQESAATLFETALRSLSDIASQSGSAADTLAQAYAVRGSWHHRKEQVDLSHKDYQRAFAIWRELFGDPKCLPEYRERFARRMIACPIEEYRDAKLIHTQLEQVKGGASTDESDLRFELAYASLLIDPSNANDPWAELAKIDRKELSGRSLFYLALALSHQGKIEEARGAYTEGVAWQQIHAPGDWELTDLKETVRLAITP